ncbi:DUF1772 domain-containing protein [Oricola sp.]|uniref:anthrone oxygenase family protein n=1 Tax=Oricola sp. TaxID=1979950 RepID=UPI003BABBCC8
MSQTVSLYMLSGAALASGLVAGVFLTFSDFVMRSLSSAHPTAGIEAMQLINRKVYRSVFMVLLMGMVPVSAGMAVFTPGSVPELTAAWAIAGALVYLSGVFAVTAVCNVPMNKRLDAMDHAGAEARAYWRVYARRWTQWNHVRTVASLVAAGCFLAAAVISGSAA